MKPDPGSSPPLISVLVATRDRTAPLLRCLESVIRQDHPRFEVLVLDDCSTALDVPSWLAGRVTDPRVRSFRSDEHLGVAGARNALIHKSRGEILVMLDDDAWFDDAACLARIARHFQDDRRLGGLAFRVVEGGNTFPRRMLPFSQSVLRRRPTIIQESRPCSYFIGAGHAVRRESLGRVGGYQQDWKWYLQDVDLAYRLIKGGYGLLYAADVLIHHSSERSVLSASNSAGKELYFMTRHRIWFAYDHLPPAYLIVHLSAWLGYYVLMAVKELHCLSFAKGVRDGLMGLARRPRAILDRRAVSYMKQNFGRLWY